MNEYTVAIVFIVCMTIYYLAKLKVRNNPYEEIKTLNELREKGIITQEEFDEKKTELLDD